MGGNNSNEGSAGFLRSWNGNSSWNPGGFHLVKLGKFSLRNTHAVENSCVGVLGRGKKQGFWVVLFVGMGFEKGRWENIIPTPLGEKKRKRIFTLSNTPENYFFSLPPLLFNIPASANIQWIGDIEREIGGWHM